VTGNARAWRHFIELRGSIHADAEIQRLAIAVLEVLQAESPNLFGDYTVTAEGIETIWRKV
jgi:thymidylate synthase (FAD)